jgi:serine/threonine-protein kinase SBK
MGIPEMARHLEIPFNIFSRPDNYPSSGSSSKLSSSYNPCTPLKVISLQEINIEKEFDIVKTISDGRFSKLLLTQQNRERLVLKAIHCEATSAEEFSRELNYNYFLSPHPNVLTSYNVAFMWDNCFIYVQEYAPYGDLSRYVKKCGLPESQVKSIATQLVSAVEFIHSFQLVHRDIRLENILVFRKDFSLIKLGDFGQTIPSGTSLVKSNSCCASYCPPEICGIVLQERYYCHPSEDVWSLAILLINCLTGEFPWNNADITDSSYFQYIDWLKRKSLRMPEIFHSFSARFLRLLKRVLEPKASKRSKVMEISKYLTDEWIVRGSIVASRRTSVERHESNATSKSGHRQRYYTVKKRSTRSLALDNELESEAETVNEKVGKWIQSSVILKPSPLAS